MAVATHVALQHKACPYELRAQQQRRGPQTSRSRPSILYKNCVAPSRIKLALTIAMSGGNQAYWEGDAAGSVLDRLGEPDDVAHGVAWLCSERASFITGIVLDINGATVMR